MAKRDVQVKYGALIDWSDLQNLEGRLLTYVDATYSDKEQREAQKSLIRNTVRDWMRDVEGDYRIFGSLKVTAHFKDDPDSTSVVAEVDSYSAEEGGSSYETLSPNTVK